MKVPANLSTHFTHKAEIEECSKSPSYFIEKYVKYYNYPQGQRMLMTLADYQHDQLSLFRGGSSLQLMSRMSRKTTLACAYILWLLLFRKDVNVGIITKQLSIQIIREMHDDLPVFLQTKILVNRVDALLTFNGNEVIRCRNLVECRGRYFTDLFVDEVDVSSDVYTFADSVTIFSSATPWMKGLLHAARPGVGEIKVTIDDTPWMDKKLTSSMLSPAFFKSEYLCEF